MAEHSQRVTLEWDGEWWTVSDEGGEFARATEMRQALHYAADLMHGPPTAAAGLLRDLAAQRHGKTERLRAEPSPVSNGPFGV